MRGRKALEAYYASIDAATRKKAQVLKAVFPEDLGEYSDEKLYGRGPMEIRSLDNAIIEVAADGKTAKGFFYVFGLVTDISERGPISNWVLRKAAALTLFEKTVFGKSGMFYTWRT